MYCTLMYMCSRLISIPQQYMIHTAWPGTHTDMCLCPETEDKKTNRVEKQGRERVKRSKIQRGGEVGGGGKQVLTGSTK